MKLSGHTSNICGWTLWAILALLLIVSAAYAQERKPSPHPRTAPQDQDVKIPVEEPTVKPSASATHAGANLKVRSDSGSNSTTAAEMPLAPHIGSAILTIVSVLSRLLTITLAIVVIIGIRSLHKLSEGLGKLQTEVDRLSKSLSARINGCARVEDVEGLLKLRSELDAVKREINKPKLDPGQGPAHPGDGPIQGQAAEMAPSSMGTASGLTTPTEMRREWEKQGILIGKAGWSRFSGQFEQEAAPPTVWLGQSSPSDKVVAIPYGDKLTSGDFEAYYQKAFRIRRPALGRMVVVRPAVLALEMGGYRVEELGELDVED
jgi:hypothetical protein